MAWTTASVRTRLEELGPEREGITAVAAGSRMVLKLDLHEFATASYCGPVVGAMDFELCLPQSQLQPETAAH